jgi:hypothetical protein
MVISDLREFSGHQVRLRLDDGTELHGILRTELLTDRSISVFIAADSGEGATVYIDQIMEIALQN